MNETEKPIRYEDIRPGMRIHAKWQMDNQSPNYDIYDTVEAVYPSRIVFTECEASLAASFWQIVEPFPDGYYTIAVGERSLVLEKRDGVWLNNTGGFATDSISKVYEEHAVLIPTYDPDTHAVILKTQGRTWADHLTSGGFPANANLLREACDADPVIR